MRISFDVDDTLVCDPSVPTEQFLPWWKGWRYPERLRRGTRELMCELLRQQHQLWIYTTSYRSPRYLRGWFRGFGIPIWDVVNQQRHERVVGRHGLPNIHRHSGSICTSMTPTESRRRVCSIASACW
jgi:hypothetical protein